MVYNVFTYRRPAYIEPVSYASSMSSEPSVTFELVAPSRQSTTSTVSGIPEALTFDKIISGGTCPPMTCRDFMRYLVYVEHDCENLQFFLWYRDYCRRFEALPESEKALSPEHIPPQGSAFKEKVASPKGARVRTPKSGWAFDRIFADFGSPNTTVVNIELAPPSPLAQNADPFRTPPGSPGVLSFEHGPPKSPTASPLAGVDHLGAAKKAFERVDVRIQPFTVQPMRDEIARIIAIYLSEGAPRELNLSSKDRTASIKALAQTTHPSALKAVHRHIEDILRLQSHPNFIRWSICNGNRPRVLFARGLGVVTVLISCIMAVLLILGSVKRGHRALVAIPLVIGFATLYAGLKGMCVVLHGLHHRHIRPWELWGDEGDFEKGYEEELDRQATANSYEDEPWVKKYEKRNLIRKIFDREVWVEEPALRQIQDTIALQALGIAVLASATLTAIFVAVPGGGFY